MGASVSTLTEQVSEQMHTSENSSCSAQSVCQNATVGSIDITDSTFSCDNITLAKNTNTSAFSCSINQGAYSTANTLLNAKNTAAAAWGDGTAADASINVAVNASTQLSSACGGQNGATTGAAAAGACRSGIVQKATVEALKIDDSKVSCDTMGLAVNTNNTHMTCTLQQMAKMDTLVKAAVDNAAISSNSLLLLVLIVMLVIVFVFTAPILIPEVAWLGSSTATMVHDFVAAVLPQKTAQEERVQGEREETQLLNAKVENKRLKRLLEAKT